MNIHENWKKFLNEESTKVLLKDLSSSIEKYKDSVWIFFDTETTGLDGRTAQLLEVAAVSVRSDLAEDAGVISQYHTKVNLTPETEKKRSEPHVPKNPRDKSIDDLLKMTQYYSTSAGAKYIEEKEALQGFLDYLKSVSPEGKIVLVAHNANFDKTFIDTRNKVYGLPPIKYEIIDTLQIMQEVFYPLLHVVDEMGILPKIKTKFGYSFTLGNVSQALNIDVDDWHSALADVKMLIKVTRAVVRSLEKNGHLDVSAGYEVAMKRKADLERWKKKQQATQLSENEENPDEYDIQESFSHWLNEGRLSKYWKRRMEARSKRAKRESKNKIDKEWARLQQDKSRKMNAKIHKIFQNEMEVTEELSEEITQFIERMRIKREEIRKKIEEKAKLIPLNKKRPKKKLPPLPTNDTIGKTSGVVDAYKKKSKKLGGNTLAPGEGFGPGE